jgi:hypothetical protein
MNHFYDFTEALSRKNYHIVVIFFTFYYSVAGPLTSMSCAEPTEMRLDSCITEIKGRS